MVKQTLKSCGGNLTQKHAEEVSFCALFLMDALKKTDREFKCNRSTSHTAKDASKDQQLLTAHLLENKVISASPERKEPSFDDPTEAGMKKISNTSWVKDTLSKLPAEEEEDFLSSPNVLDDLDYELSDVAI